MATDIGPRIGVQGESEFRNAIQNASASVKAFEAEMKLLTTQFEGNEKSQEALTQKSALLKGEIEEVQKKLVSQESALQAAASATGENSTETQKWREIVANTKTELTNLNKKLDDVDDDLEKTGDGFEKNSDDLDDLEDDLKDGKKGLGDFGKEAESTEKKTSHFGDALKSIGVAFGAMAAAAAAAAVKLGTEVVEAFADQEQLIGGVETLFGAGGQSIEEYAESVGKTVDEVRVEYASLMEGQEKVLANARDAYATAGLSANEYMETVTTFSAALVTSLEGQTDIAADVANQAIIDMSDNANKMGSDMESVMAAYNGFAKGQYTLLDNLKLGYGGTKTEMERLLKDAEAISGVHYDIDNYADVIDAIHVIQKDMGIAGTTAKEATKTISGSVNSAKSALKNLVAGLGDSNADIKKLVGNVVDSFKNIARNVKPVIENLIDALPDALSAISDALKEMLPEAAEMLGELMNQLLGTLVDILPDLIDTVSDIVVQLFGYLTDMLPDFVPILIDLIVALIDGLGKVLPDLVNAVVELTVKLLEGLADMLPDLIDTLVDALVDAILVLTNPDNLVALIEAVVKCAVAIVGGLIDNLPKILEGLWNAVTNAFAALDELWTKWCEPFIDAVGEWFSGLIEDVGGWFADIWENISEWFTGLFEDLGGWFADIWEDVSDSLSEWLGSIGEWFGKIWENISEWFSGLIEDVGGWFADIWEDVSGALSEWLGSIGRWFGKIWENITGWFGDLGKKLFGEEGFFPEIWNSISGALSEWLGSIGRWFGKLWENINGWFDGLINDLVGWGGDLASGFVNGFLSAFGIAAPIAGKTVVSSVNGMSDSALSEAKTGSKEIGEAFSGGIAKGFEDSSGAVGQRILAACRKMLDGNIRDAYGIRSPSRVMAQIGDYMAQGLVDGFGDRLKVAKNQITLMTKDAFSVEKAEIGTDFGKMVANMQESYIKAGLEMIDWSSIADTSDIGKISVVDGKAFVIDRADTRGADTRSRWNAKDAYASAMSKIYGDPNAGKVEVNVVLDGKQLATAMWDPLTGIAYQRGVPIGGR